MLSNKNSIDFPALRIRQPIGEFFVGVMKAEDCVGISWADVREIEDRDLDSYMGIQRRLSKQRVAELQDYVNISDATFPTSIILAVRDDCAIWDDEKKVLTLFANENVPFEKIARIIDGQHRVEGLKAFSSGTFEVNVSVFVGSDIATQANIFATVNLAQTKVNRSLVYDLYDYEKERSPQKTAHHIAVAIDQIKTSPFFRRIKRLGSATAGREKETLTQAAVVEAIVDLITDRPLRDRDSLLRKLMLVRPSKEELARKPFRLLFLEQKDAEITKIILEFFSAVREKWPDSWQDVGKQGNVLPKTNGFKALMRFLRHAYVELADGNFHSTPDRKAFLGLLSQSRLGDADFNITNFPPGTSGESALFNFLMEDVLPKRRETDQMSLL